MNKKTPLVILHFLRYTTKILNSLIKLISLLYTNKLIKSTSFIMEKNYIKGYIAQNGCTVKQVHDLLVKNYKRGDTIQNFTNKVNRQTLKYNEILQIADVLGYEIKWTEKK